MVLRFHVTFLFFKFCLSDLSIFNETVDHLFFNLVYLGKNSIQHLFHMISINLELIETAKDSPVNKMSYNTYELGHLLGFHLLKGEFYLVLVHY